ncbi:class I SAM-dependent methyltransferase [Alishewanella sp. 16-MA]|uniref:Class I SAM-dependent methyltransferase n=1 Tax=Alishewanella maricola TaxID=2795740 RepID=A0ABS8C629_9ALTE|nr:class I SAM-dependent methyltransferase [Alishewanella maricola]MCB5227756.1 class I SAM-dependent methyltransferase [Alishewanella maricola]
MTSEPKIIHWKSHHGTLVCNHNGFDLIDCSNCGFKHVVPLPSPEELIDVYQHDYYDQEKPLYLSRYQQDLPWWNLVYEQRYRILSQHLSSSQRTILDIGSGPGYFLLKGKELNWQVFGIEPSVQAATFSKQLGLDVFNGFFSPATADTFGKVDAINMSLVLEHIPDPAAFLTLVHQQLNKDGLLCIIVPNDFNPFQTLLNQHLDYAKWWVAPPHHLNYFNFTSLSRLLNHCGFEVVHQEATFPIDLFLTMGDNYIGHDDVGRACHTKRMTFEKNMLENGQHELLSELYSALSKLGIGREVVVYAKKSNA